MKRWMAVLPLIGLLAFALVALIQLYQPQEEVEVEAPTIVRMAPDRPFVMLSGDKALRFNPPPDGKPAIVNLFASWCGPCEVEHPFLLELQAKEAPLYGILYKDEPENGAQFLDRLGDPFRGVGQDPSGQGGLEFGLSGVPETFVVDATGQVKLHIAGPLNAARTQQVLDALEAAAR